jgi:hypothetical protein
MQAGPAPERVLIDRSRDTLLLPDVLYMMHYLGEIATPHADGSSSRVAGEAPGRAQDG